MRFYLYCMWLAFWFVCPLWASTFREADPRKLSSWATALAELKRFPLTLRMAVFTDHMLQDQFRQRYDDVATADRELQHYVFALIQHAQSIFNVLVPPVHISVVKYEILNNDSIDFSHEDNRGEMQHYLPAFCYYQKQIVGHEGWDHATLLTGYDLVHGKDNKFSGYASRDSACTAHSCSLVEASSFKGAFTLVHEIGHSLGMAHDGVHNECNASCCIMSPVVTSGKYDWSTCSQVDFWKFLTRLRMYGLDCLVRPLPVASLSHNSDDLRPGQRYTLDDQCRFYFGPCYSHAFQQDALLSTVCKEIWCTNGGRFINVSHAALDGTYCAPGSWCESGECVKSHLKLVRIDGQWSAWTDLPSSNSAQCDSPACSDCEIENQIRLRKMMRTCNNPSPNNDGTPCNGSMYKPVVCQPERCSGVKPDTYANKVCTKLKKILPDHPRVKNFTGLGVQRIYNAFPCFVWCGLEPDNKIVYTLFDRFPDGTPCGDNKFCVAGECMHIAINPLSERNLKNADSYWTLLYGAATEEPPWGAWAECSVTCGHGTQQRSRVCPATHSDCKQTQLEMRVCRGRPCVQPATSTTTELSAEYSSVVTTLSSKLTTLVERAMLTTAPEVRASTLTLQTSVLTHAPVTDAVETTKTIIRSGSWSSWGNWRSCSQPCGGGSQIGLRTCFPIGGRCDGANTKKRRCNVRAC